MKAGHHVLRNPSVSRIRQECHTRPMDGPVAAPEEGVTLQSGNWGFVGVRSSSLQGEEPFAR